MGILTWIIFGLIAGAIAKAIHPGKDPRMDYNNYHRNSGSYAWRLAWINAFGVDVTGFNFSSFLVAIGGSVLLLFLYRMVANK
jgi:uncharacterized membrane protein YeaQ/YmgE (transglycosylase-associated protein family)